MKLRVGINPMNLVVSDKTMENSGGKVSKEALRELASDLSSKLNTMSDLELSTLFTSFSIVKDEAIETPVIGMIIEIKGVGPAVIVKINKKTANAITVDGVSYSCGLGGLILSKVTLEEFKNMREYNIFNKKDSGSFYKINSKNGWISCLLICSGKKYKLHMINDLKRFFTLTDSDFNNEKVCELDFKEAVSK